MCLSLYAEPMESPNNPNPNSPSSQKTFGGCRLLLVDGSNLMFQMFYGMPSRIVNKQGVAIHGVLGFVGAFLRIVGLVEPSHILVVFDGEHENPRVLLDDQYKANRPDFSAMQEEETPFSQMPYIYDALDHMGVKRLETVHFEADDVIASCALRFWQEGGGVVIASMDSDFFQLVKAPSCDFNDGIEVLRYRGKQSIVCDWGYVCERFGVSPDLYCAFKSLVGDTSDNIKGVCGIGPKTAAKLLAQYGSLESVIAHCDEIKPSRIGMALKAGQERLFLNHRLIELGANVPLPLEYGELCLSPGLSNGLFSTRKVLEDVGLM